MSIAPAKSASIAEGPALKLFHSTFTFGPMAFSKRPFAFPTIAWGCVMFGNAPTRTVVCANPSTANTMNSKTPRTLLLIFSPVRIAVHDHGQHSALVCFLAGLLTWLTDPRTNDIGQGGVLEDAGRGVPHVQEHLVQRAMFSVTINERTELVGIPEGGERAVNQANDFAEMDFRGRTAKLVTALGAAHAFNHAGVFHFEKDQLEKLFGKVLFVGDIANANGALVIVAGQHHH